MGTPPSKFNLFDAEDRILAEAEALLRQADSSTEALHGGLEQLVQAYGLGIKEQRRLVKLSDRQQSQVSKLNKELAQRTSQASGLTTVCLSGGCMHNRLLTRLLVEELERFGLRPLLHRQVSPGDGGISYGQAAIAAARLTAI